MKQEEKDKFLRNLESFKTIYHHDITPRVKTFKSIAPNLKELHAALQQTTDLVKDPQKFFGSLAVDAKSDSSGSNSPVATQYKLVKVKMESKPGDWKTIKVSNETSAADIFRIAAAKFKMSQTEARLYALKFEKSGKDLKEIGDNRNLYSVLQEMELNGENLCVLFCKQVQELTVNCILANQKGVEATMKIYPETTAKQVIQNIFNQLKLNGEYSDYILLEYEDDFDSCILNEASLYEHFCKNSKNYSQDYFDIFISPKYKEKASGTLLADAASIKNAEMCSGCRADACFVAINMGKYFCKDCAFDKLLLNTDKPDKIYHIRPIHFYSLTEIEQSILKHKLDGSKRRRQSFDNGTKGLIAAAIRDNDFTSLIDLVSNLDRSSISSNPLFEAAVQGNGAAMQLLLDLGFNPIHKNSQGKTPLHWISQKPSQRSFYKKFKEYQILYGNIVNNEQRHLNGGLQWIVGMEQITSKVSSKLTRDEFINLVFDVMAEISNRLNGHTLSQESAKASVKKLSKLSDTELKQFCQDIFDDLGIREYLQLHSPAFYRSNPAPYAADWLKELLQQQEFDTSIEKQFKSQPNISGADEDVASSVTCDLNGIAQASNIKNSPVSISSSNCSSTSEAALDEKLVLMSPKQKNKLLRYSEKMREISQYLMNAIRDVLAAASKPHRNFQSDSSKMFEAVDEQLRLSEVISMDPAISLQKEEIIRFSMFLSMSIKRFRENADLIVMDDTVELTESQINQIRLSSYEVAKYSKNLLNSICQINND